MLKIKALFDSRSTWLVLGTFTGSMFGEKIANLVSAIGETVMWLI